MTTNIVLENVADDYQQNRQQNEMIARADGRTWDQRYRAEYMCAEAEGFVTITDGEDFYRVPARPDLHVTGDTTVILYEDDTTLLVRGSLVIVEPEDGPFSKVLAKAGEYSKGNVIGKVIEIRRYYGI